MRIAVDVGGTFTDVIVLDEKTNTLRLEKVETTPQDPAAGVLQSFQKANARLSDIDYFVHGATLGLNALLTRTGARVAIVTTKGFRDIYELGRTSHDPMYDFKYRKPKTLVPRYLAFEVTERSDFQGNVLTPFDHAEAAAVARQIRTLGVEAVAVCFLHSYANPAHELAMEEVLRHECPELLVTLSHRLSREYREYERTSTAVMDAYIKPVIRSYLEKLDGGLRRGGFTGYFLLIRSGGGAMTVASATEQPVHSVLSGPAGGVIGARSLSQLIGHANRITLDMGGTSLDASLVVDGQITIEHEASFEGLPISIPTIDIKTIGAGGGSIGWIDDGGHLQVGPQSAGAVPGPACYGKADVSAISRIYAGLVERGQQALGRDGFQAKAQTFLCSAELRYQGQEHTVNVPIPGRDLTASDIARIADDFNAAHLTQYSHHMNDPVEIVTLRVSAVGLLPRPLLPTIAAGTGGSENARKGNRSVYQPALDTTVDYAVYDRGRLLCGDRIDGPAIIEEPSSTTVLHPGDVMTVGQYGELVIEVGKR